jgi:hypothetical protein
MASWLRRSFAAATIFMALVIFCVDLTDAIRSRTALSEGMKVLEVLSPVYLACGLKILPNSVSTARIFSARPSKALPSEPFCASSLHEVALLGIGEGVQLALVATERPRPAGVDEAVGGREQNQDLLFHRQGHVLALLEQLGDARAAGQLLLGGLVQVGAELGEGGEGAVLGELEAQLAGDLLHGRDLGRAADAADRQMPTFTAGRWPE